MPVCAWLCLWGTECNNAKLQWTYSSKPADQNVAFREDPSLSKVIQFSSKQIPWDHFPARPRPVGTPLQTYTHLLKSLSQNLKVTVSSGRFRTRRFSSVESRFHLIHLWLFEKNIAKSYLKKISKESFTTGYVWFKSHPLWSILSTKMIIFPFD